MQSKDIYIDKSVMTVLEQLHACGFDAYIVGGCVRDSIIGEIPKDWDVTTSALPEEVREVFSGFTVIDTGIKHGTVTVILDHVPIEVTTFRTEFGYSDNRRPDRVEFVTDIRADLSRRDFTMNALAYDGVSDNVLDLFGGRADIEARCIRCVGDPAERFEEDALRILRALRFSAVLGFEIDHDTASAVHEKRKLLKNIAAERIFSELKQLLRGADCTRVLREFGDVIAVFMPEIKAMFGFSQNIKYHCYDVWEHTLHSIDAVPRDAALRFTMLFHDSGKPECRTVEAAENGSIDHFYGHAEVSRVLAGTVMERLKTDNRFYDTVTDLICRHDVYIPPTRKGVKRWLNKLGEERFWQLLAVKRADTLAQALEFRLERLIELDTLKRLADDVIKSGSCFGLKDLAINGDDCISIGLRGREIGSALNSALNAVMDERISNNKQDILDYLEGECL